MEILGRTPAECFNAFKSALATLVSNCLDTKAHLGLEYAAIDTKAKVSFVHGDEVSIKLKTKEHGPIYLSLAQDLEAVREDRGPHKGKYRLYTRSYRYRIHARPDADAPAIIRWEYEGDYKPDSACCHHVQIGAVLDGGLAKTLDLNRLHTPTGWVTIENVLRFLITEFGVQPPCGNSWPTRLRKSVERFYKASAQMLASAPH